MPNQNSNQAEAVRQQLLPQVRLTWFFAAITLAALLIMLVRWAGEARSLIVSLVAIVGWIGGLFALFGLLFLLTYSLGILETLLAPPEPEVLSPFATDRLPEQVVKPLHGDQN